MRPAIACPPGNRPGDSFLDLLRNLSVNNLLACIVMQVAEFPLGCFHELGVSVACRIFRLFTEIQRKRGWLWLPRYVWRLQMHCFQRKEIAGESFFWL